MGTAHVHREEDMLLLCRGGDVVVVVEGRAWRHSRHTIVALSSFLGGVQRDTVGWWCWWGMDTGRDDNDTSSSSSATTSSITINDDDEDV